METDIFDVPSISGCLFFMPTSFAELGKGGINLNRKRLQFLLEIAILGAISFVLDKIGFSMPQGGSVTLSMLPIVVMAFRWGIVGGMLTGFVSGSIATDDGWHMS